MGRRFKFKCVYKVKLSDIRLDARYNVRTIVGPSVKDTDLYTSIGSYHLRRSYSR